MNLKTTQISILIWKQTFEKRQEKECEVKAGHKFWQFFYWVWHQGRNRDDKEFQKQT